MKRICEDYIDYGKEKDITDYILDVENNTLLIHTLCIIKGEGSSHTNELCKLTAETSITPRQYEWKRIVKNGA